MRLICVMCGRATEPTVMVGGMAVGPKCAAKAGLLPHNPRRKAFKFQRESSKPKDADTLELFVDDGV